MFNLGTGGREGGCYWTTSVQLLQCYCSTLYPDAVYRVLIDTTYEHLAVYEYPLKLVTMNLQSELPS